MTSQRGRDAAPRSATSPAGRVLLCLPDLRLLPQQEAEAEHWVCRKLQNRLLNLRLPADEQSSFLVINCARPHGNMATFTSTDLAPLKTTSNFFFCFVFSPHSQTSFSNFPMKKTVSAPTSYQAHGSCVGPRENYKSRTVRLLS